MPERDWIDELVDEQLSQRPEQVDTAWHVAAPTNRATRNCGACRCVWYGYPVCPWCGRSTA